ARVVDDLLAVHPDLQQPGAVERVAELEDEVRPLPEADRNVRVLEARLAAAVRVGAEHLERAAALRTAVRDERERRAVALARVAGVHLRAEEGGVAAHQRAP